MTPTQEFVARLAALGPAELAVLRRHAGRPLNQSLEAFDLFTGLWWPLRAKSQRAPRRQVAWLVAKLYARCPLVPSAEPTDTLPRRLGRVSRGPLATSHEARFSLVLSLPLAGLEPALTWAIDTVGALAAPRLNWTALIDDLSQWEKPSVRRSWAEQFLNSLKRSEDAH